MRIILFLLILLSLFSCKKSKYEQILSDRLTEIRELRSFNNAPVVYSDSLRNIIYSIYDGDHILYHPYQFLRDTAKIEDLLDLIKDKHPFIRTYAYGSLQNRNFENLYSILINQLSDTTKFTVVTNDYVFESTPADMMLEYSGKYLNSTQKDSIAKLIITKYNDLNSLDEILLFHKPNPKNYNYIKQIVKNEETGKFGLIALARYQQNDDIPLIKNGFSQTNFYSGYNVFFMAIEEFNHEDFKCDLIAYNVLINKGWHNQGQDYYFNALAKYHDEECINVIKEFIDVKDYQSPFYKFENLRMIRKSLEKYYTNEYESLITQIDSILVDQKEFEPEDNYLLKSPWNY